MLRPLVDIKGFTPTTINENTSTSNLLIYVNGTLRSNATVVLNKTGTATYLTDNALQYAVTRHGGAEAAAAERQ